MQPVNVCIFNLIKTTFCYYSWLRLHVQYAQMHINFMEFFEVFSYFRVSCQGIGEAEPLITRIYTRRSPALMETYERLCTEL